MSKTYECGAAHCTLGTVGNPGLFKGGISKEGVHLLTGRPVELLVKDADYGEGFCPNCGTQGADHDPAAAVKAHLEDQIKQLQAQLKEVSN